MRVWSVVLGLVLGVCAMGALAQTKEETEGWERAEWAVFFDRIAEAEGAELEALDKVLLMGRAYRWRNYSDDEGVTLLMHAMSRVPETGMLYSLKFRREDFELRDHEGRTALHHAARNPDERVVQFLIGLVYARQADMTVTDDHGRDVLMHLFREGHGSRAVRQLFELAEIDVNRVDEDGYSSVAYAAMECTDFRVMEVLGEHGADFERAFTDQKLRAIHLAARENMAEVAMALIREGVEVDALDAQGGTALMWGCAHNKDPLMAPSLLKGGADPTIVNTHGLTVTHAAAMGGQNASVLEQLLEAGAPVDPVVEGQPTLSPARLYARYGDDPGVWGVLGARGADLNRKGAEESPMVMVAMERGADVEFIGAMIDAGCDVNDGYAPFKMTPLLMALAQGSPEMVEMLLDHGADVRAVSVDGRGALEHAQRSEQLEGHEVLARIKSMLED